MYDRRSAKDLRPPEIHRVLWAIRDGQRGLALAVYRVERPQGIAPLASAKSMVAARLSPMTARVGEARPRW